MTRNLKPNLYAMTHRQIAEAEGISFQAVQQIEKRALKKLRRKFPIFLTILSSLTREDDHCRHYAERTAPKQEGSL